MATYHLIGIISALLSILASAGLATQVRLLWKRHRERQEGQSISEGLSLNRFVTSFIVFLALFTYGGLLDPFNHYLAWPRVIGICIVLLILWIIFRDRKCRGSAWSFIGCLSAFLISALVVAFERPIEDPNMIVLPTLVVVVSLLYLQGGIVQIQMIRRSRKTGGLSYGMHLLFVLKDISLVVFAIAMGARDGWPILFTCAIGLTVNVTTLWCFRWVSLPSTQCSQ
jgi:peptidoglycan/LPS O-acetylase OafA/YrhL